MAEALERSERVRHVYVHAGGKVEAATLVSMHFASETWRLWGGLDELETLDEAVARARQIATGQGWSVLLSPACASFDQFKSYAHRGDVFEALVRGLQ